MAAAHGVNGQEAGLKRQDWFGLAAGQWRRPCAVARSRRIANDAADGRIAGHFTGLNKERAGGINDHRGGERRGPRGRSYWPAIALEVCSIFAGLDGFRRLANQLRRHP
jgi:hypothetical protein